MNKSTHRQIDLSGKNILVTGASKGIGAGIAKHLAACGATVIVNYATSADGAKKVVSEIASAGGKAVAIVADVSKPADVDRLFGEAAKAVGRIDVLVNNAGRFEPAPLDAVSEENFRRNFDTNVLGLIVATRKAVSQFGDQGGVIVNVGSAIVRAPMSAFLTYGASKAAADYVTKALAVELGPKKVRINSVQPGVVDTEGARAVGAFQKEFVDMVVSRTPLGRPGQPQDIASVVAFLASDAAGWLTGELIGATGGLH